MKTLIANTLAFSWLYLIIALVAFVPLVKGFIWALYFVLLPIGWVSGEPIAPPEFG